MLPECEGRHEPEDERRDNRQESVDKDRRHDTGVAAAEADECAGQAKLDDTDPAGSDRNRGEDANKRPGRKGFDQRDLRGGNTKGAQRDDEQGEDSQACQGVANAAR
jgi:hypothetical protein